MSRSRARNTTVAPPLFPFLAVLLCTLGVLVLLLTAMASVQVDAARKKQRVVAAPPLPLTAEQLQLKAQFEMAKRQLTRYDAAREPAERRLEVATGRLTTVEQSMREQQLRLEKLRTAIDELAALDREHHIEIEEARERLAILEQRVNERRRELELRREDTTRRSKSYAILPYDGPNGTTRRPVYIECLEDRVVIQPEGIELGPADFNLQLGQGMPLAAALRAARDYYVRTDSEIREQAYPLILVRPEGVGSYLAVMATLDMWESDYGYEMIASDWKLDCGAANPQLSQELQLAVANARTAAMAQASRAPIAFREGSLDSFTPAPSLLDSLQAAPPTKSGIVDYDNLVATMAAGRTPTGAIDTSRLAAALAQSKDSTSGSRGGGGGVGASEEVTEAGGERGAGTSPNGITGIESDKPGTGRGLAATGEAGGSSSGVAMQGATAQPGSAPAAPGQTGGVGATSPGTMNSGETIASPTAVAGNQQSPTTPPPTVVADQSQIGQASNPDGGQPPGTAPNAQPQGKGLMVERPVRIELLSDRIIVGRNPYARGHRDRDAGRTVMLDKSPRETSEAFSKAVRQHVGDWGIAGNDSEWKPVLVLYVEPGSEDLAEQLATALRASGVEVRVPDTVRR